MEDRNPSINRSQAVKDYIFPDIETFTEASGKYDLAMVTCELPCDLETPISALMKLKGNRSCFLLESVEKGETWGRYSFLGFDPLKSARSVGGKLLVSNGSSEREIEGHPVRNLFQQVEATRVLLPDNKLPFTGGAVGYFGYDMLPYLEKVTVTGKPTGLPEMMFMFPRRIVVFDHLRSRVRLGVFAEIPPGVDDCGEHYRLAVMEVIDMIEKLNAPLSLGLGRPIGELGSDDFAGVKSNMSRRQFEKSVEDIREYIYAGDAFQVVISQRFSLDIESEPLSIYRFLRSENPSPYMFYLELPDVSLVGSSPETMVTNRSGKAIMRPIAGTRPRAEGEMDELYARQLKEDPKEAAEHIMLVDLTRNDLGRVSRAGTVKVTSLMEVERYSHVMHMVSQVEGELKEGMGNYELLRSSFPAGTVSGAPKVRACQIIDELESDMRGPYAGAVGYLSYSGDMDTCIAIRTIVIEGDHAWIQAGAGIVADSVPSNEWEESRNKARALVRAAKAGGGEAL